MAICQSVRDLLAPHLRIVTHFLWVAKALVQWQLHRMKCVNEEYGRGNGLNRNITETAMSLWGKSHTSVRNSPDNTQGFRSMLIQEYILKFLGFSSPLRWRIVNLWNTGALCLALIVVSGLNPNIQSLYFLSSLETIQCLLLKWPLLTPPPELRHIFT